MKTLTTAVTKQINNDIGRGVAALVSEYLEERSAGGQLYPQIGEQLMDIGDYLASEISCSADLNDLLAQWEHQYRPTLRGNNDPATRALADIYDLCAFLRGKTMRIGEAITPLRCYRGDSKQELFFQARLNQAMELA